MTGRYARSWKTSSRELIAGWLPCAHRRRHANTCCTRLCSARGRCRDRTKAFVERMQAYALKAAARGQAGDQLAPSAEHYEDGAQAPRRAHSGSRRIGGFPAVARALAQRAGAAGRTELLSQLHAEGDAARRARFLSGHRVLGFVAGRSRQPPPGRFRRARGCAGGTAHAELGKARADVGRTGV